MLPPELSSNLASLVPKKDRLCLAVDVELTAKGTIHRYRFVEGLMRSSARLTYGGAARALGLTDQGPKQKDAESRVEMLSTLLEASRLLRQRRLQRGALDFDLPEARVKLNEEGEPTDVIRSRQDPGVREAYRLVEEMMLLANEVVAADLTERVVPAIYRVHGKPDDSKIELFCKLAASLGYDLSVDSAQDPRELSRFLKRIEGTPQADTLRYLLLRSMQQAMYDVDPTVGHFGLAARDYLHFTSPIRRYPDLAVHRVVRSVLRSEPIDAALVAPRLRKMAAQSSRLERRSMTVERDVVGLYRAILMRDRLGEEFDATVSGVESHGIYVSFDAPFVEALVPVERLGEDSFQVDDLGIRLTAQRSGMSYTLGDKIRVHLLDVNIERREIIAIPVERVGKAPSERPPKRRQRAQASSKRAGDAGRSAPKRPDKSPRQREETPKRLDEPPRRRNETPKRPDKSPWPRDEAEKRPDEAPRRRNEAPKRPDKSPRRRNEAPKRPDEAPTQWYEAPKAEAPKSEAPSERPQRVRKAPRRQPKGDGKGKR
jgi:ribonuclease R